MPGQWTAFPATLLPASLLLIGGCAAHPARADAEDTARQVEICCGRIEAGRFPLHNRLEEQIVGHGGVVLDKVVTSHDPLIGYVDAAYPYGGDSEFDTTVKYDCWRLSFEQKPGDPFIRGVETEPIDCPPVIDAGR